MLVLLKGMIALVGLIMLFVAIPLGMIRPRLVRCRSRGWVLGVYGGAAFLILVLIGVTEPAMDSGRRAMEQRSWESAVTSFAQVEPGDPEHAQARLLLATAADSLWAPADSALRQKEWDRAAELIQQARRHEPLRARADSAMRVVLLLRDTPAR